MINEIIVIVKYLLIGVLIVFLIYWIGRFFAMGIFDGIDKKLMNKFNEHKSKEDERKEK